jgi:RimJ/RimL family protein N-acetyltransferase
LADGRQPETRVRIEWDADGIALAVVEPTPSEVRVHAAALAVSYNEPRNRALMTNDHTFSADDVVDQFTEMREAGGRPFLLFAGDAMTGDCDLRHIEGKAAEYAVMVGAHAHQGKGLGTRYTTMLHAYAFGPLGLQTIYVAVRPENLGSLRMFEKVGYAVDQGAAARRFAEADDDVCMSIEKDAFLTAHRTSLRSIRIIEE